MQEVTIQEAANRLGMSMDSIRRRISRGELKARKVKTAHGVRYLVELPDDLPPPAGDSPQSHSSSLGEVEALRKTVSLLETELESRRREVEQLHILLQRSQALLPMPRPEPWWRRMFAKPKQT